MEMGTNCSVHFVRYASIVFNKNDVTNKTSSQLHLKFLKSPKQKPRQTCYDRDFG